MVTYFAVAYTSASVKKLIRGDPVNANTLNSMLQLTKLMENTTLIPIQSHTQV